ncbi:class I SAM-dependent methyltransferase [Actinoplanes sp. NPDC051513]|uniref:class I SAM-dependent methyltransferase n=1 Tax=Actinoplanes sp. NPDC051513 TaxID=3363908 RepID=UPI0037B12C28
MTDIFWRAHQGLPREAPGSGDTTALLLRLAAPLPGRPRIVDVGCGPGAATVRLAQLPGGHVTGVDLHQPFLDAVAARALAAGVLRPRTSLGAAL